jgi:lysophospholipase L1-like esterase
VIVQLVVRQVLPFESSMPALMLVWLSIAIIMTLGRHRLLRRPRPLKGIREYFTVLRVCVIVLLFAESIVAWGQPLRAKPIGSLERVTEEPAPFSKEKPTFLTLGSSPANLEILTDHPFSRVLSERQSDIANFRFFRMGGADSAHLVEVLKETYESPRPVDAIILYAGFQDINISPLQRYLRQTNMLESSDLGRGIVLWFIRDSALFNFLLRAVRTLEVRAPRDESIEKARSVLAGLRPNVESIIKMAREHGDTVFLLTMVMNLKNVADSTVFYVTMMNEYYRSLATRYDNVIVVDFARAFEIKYPDGALPNGEPFEMRNDGSGQPGDPFHLGPVGHQMIADTLEPEIRMWAEKWHTAK